MSLQHEIDEISRLVYTKISDIEQRQKQLVDAKKALKKLLGELIKLTHGKTPSLST